MTSVDRQLLDVATEMAEQSASQGGIPIGAALGTRDGEIISTGYNRRVQDGDPTAHAEMNCIRRAGRRRDWRELILASTLSPCIMCTGACLLFRIPRVVIGENVNFMGAEDLFKQHGVSLVHADDSRCQALMTRFIAEQPDLWHEDIGE